MAFSALAGSPPSLPTLSPLASRQAAHPEMGLVVVRFSVGPFLPEGREELTWTDHRLFPRHEAEALLRPPLLRAAQRGRSIVSVLQRRDQDPRQQMVSHRHMAGGHQNKPQTPCHDPARRGASRCREVGPFPALSSLSPSTPSALSGRPRELF